MPWVSSDVDKHVKGLSKKQKKKWATMANAVLSSCNEQNGKDCEGMAIRIANSKFSAQAAAFNPAMTAAQADAIEAAKNKVEMDDGLETIDEMEIFRAGTHNKQTFTEDDLQEMADNFQKLKNEVRPKMKITHRDNQETLAGLAAYGDIMDVFMKKVEDGSKRLFAKIVKVPKQVVDFIKNRRFPERSIELYPKFQLGTQENAPVYKNVLKAIALLGHEMPAVTGMAPVKLSEQFESQKTVCIGQVCFACKEAADNYSSTLIGIELIAKNIERQL